MNTPLTQKGKREWALLALLVGCGLRREGLVRLHVEDVQLRDERWVIPELVGKGQERLDIWTTSAEIREKRNLSRDCARMGWWRASR